jgi:hypothetical protein
VFALPSPPDITNTTSSPFEDRRGREETFVTGDRSVPAEPTLFIGYKSDVPTLRHDVPTTITTAELQQSQPAAASLAQARTQEDEVSRTREARLMLLARRYERAANTEDEARLHILTERLRRLAPRVTEADTTELSTMVGELEAMSENVSEIRRRYGLG